MENLSAINRQLRRWILEMTTQAKSGHPTSSLSAVELMSSLMFGRINDEAFFYFDKENPDNLANDRLVFSKGHASPLYYALWAMADIISPEELRTYRQFTSNLEGHPTRQFPLTEVPTGSLGQGLSAGIGLALYMRNIAQTQSRVFVLLGDSEMAEGQVWEAMQLATYYQLSNLVAIVDVNRLGQCGETMLGYDIEVYQKRAESFGWQAIIVRNGHNVDDVYHAFAQIEHNRPAMIIAHTTKGRGVSFLENQDGWHGKPLSEDELVRALTEIGEEEFVAPALLAKPENALLRGTDSLQKQTDTLSFAQYTLGGLVAPRDAYGDAIAMLAQDIDDIVVMDAETSNSTRADRVKAVMPHKFYEMFIAEQNMVSVAVGMARYGTHPFVSSFAAFLTRATDQIRMAQYAGVNMTFVGSHCGVSIGADGGSQMGLEDMAIFGALRQSTILYPADAVATAKLTQLAYDTDGLSYLRITRAKLPVLYSSDEEFRIGSSKILMQSDSDVVTICAAGITVHESLMAAQELISQGVNVRVIDCYSIRPFDKNTIAQSVRETGKVIAVEDHHEYGGLGDAVRRAICGTDNVMVHLAVRKMPHSGTPEELLAYQEIDKNAIIKSVQTMLKSNY